MLYLAAAAIVFGVNLMPALGPPSWAVLVLLKLNWHLNSVALVVIGAAAAGSGRYLLSRATRALRGRLSQKRRDNLASAQEYLTSHRAGAVLGLALFALSPLPSAQLFEAAGIMTVPLLTLTFVFFLGRLVSYAIYLSAASLAQHSYGGVFTSALRSPVGIAVEVASLIAVVGLSQIDIRRLRLRRRPPQAPNGGSDAERS